MPKEINLSRHLRLSLCSALLCSVLLLLLPGLLFGQITSMSNDTSVPTPGLGHDYIKLLSETVNPANGAVSLRIQIPMPPGRGLSVPFSFSYDSNGAIFLTTAGVAAGTVKWTTNWGYLSQGGWSYSAPMLSEQGGQLSEVRGKIKYTCDYIDHFVFRERYAKRILLGGGRV